MNSVKAQIERQRQAEIKELKKKEDVKKLAVFEDVFGLVGAVMAIFTFYYICKGWLF